MEQQTIEALGDRLFTALKEGTTLSPFTATHPPIQIEDLTRGRYTSRVDAFAVEELSRRGR